MNLQTERTRGAPSGDLNTFSLSSRVLQAMRAAGFRVKVRACRLPVKILGNPEKRKKKTKKWTLNPIDPKPLNP